MFGQSEKPRTPKKFELWRGLSNGPFGTRQMPHRASSLGYLNARNQGFHAMPSAHPVAYSHVPDVVIPNHDPASQMRMKADSPAGAKVIEFRKSARRDEVLRWRDEAESLIKDASEKARLANELQTITTIRDAEEAIAKARPAMRRVVENRLSPKGEMWRDRMHNEIFEVSDNIAKAKKALDRPAHVVSLADSRKALHKGISRRGQELLSALRSGALPPDAGKSGSFNTLKCLLDAGFIEGSIYGGAEEVRLTRLGAKALREADAKARK